MCFPGEGAEEKKREGLIALPAFFGVWVRCDCLPFRELAGWLLEK